MLGPEHLRIQQITFFVEEFLVILNCLTQRSPSVSAWLPALVSWLGGSPIRGDPAAVVTRTVLESQVQGHRRHPEGRPSPPLLLSGARLTATPICESQAGSMTSW